MRLSRGVRAYPTKGTAAMQDVLDSVPVWMIVLIYGTLWRVLSYHAMAHPSVHLQHLGMAMATQY